MKLVENRFSDMFAFFAVCRFFPIINKNTSITTVTDLDVKDPSQPLIQHNRTSTQNEK